MSVTRVPYEPAGGEWGVGELWYADGRLVWHELPRTPTHAREGLRPPPSRSTIAGSGAQDGAADVPESHHLVHTLDRYFAGEAVSFGHVAVDESEWTPFQADVAAAVRSVEWGKIVSYAELARLAGYLRAQRAVGTFCARNRFPLVLPCHRVVGSNGIGSYGSLGIGYKQRLLALEGVAL